MGLCMQITENPSRCDGTEAESCFKSSKKKRDLTTLTLDEQLYRQRCIYSTLVALHTHQQWSLGIHAAVRPKCTTVDPCEHESSKMDIRCAHVAGAFDDARDDENADEGRGHAAQPKHQRKLRVQQVREAERQRC